MENGGQTHLPKDQPVVIGELPWQLLGDSNRRLLVLACPREIDVREAITARGALIEAVASAMERPEP